MSNVKIKPIQPLEKQYVGRKHKHSGFMNLKDFKNKKCVRLCFYIRVQWQDSSPEQHHLRKKAFSVKMLFDCSVWGDQAITTKIRHNDVYQPGQTAVKRTLLWGNGWQEHHNHAVKRELRRLYSQWITLKSMKWDQGQTVLKLSHSNYLIRKVVTTRKKESKRGYRNRKLGKCWGWGTDLFPGGECMTSPPRFTGFPAAPAQCDVMLVGQRAGGAQSNIRAFIPQESNRHRSVVWCGFLSKWRCLGLN